MTTTPTEEVSKWNNSPDLQLVGHWRPEKKNEFKQNCVRTHNNRLREQEKEPVRFVEFGLERFIFEKLPWTGFEI